MISSTLQLPQYHEMPATINVGTLLGTCHKMSATVQNNFSGIFLTYHEMPATISINVWYHTQKC